MAVTNGECRDRVMLDEWHPIWAIDEAWMRTPTRSGPPSASSGSRPHRRPPPGASQNPKLLPLDPRAETPIRSDRASITYRRWLSDLGVTYGVIPAA